MLIIAIRGFTKETIPDSMIIHDVENGIAIEGIQFTEGAKKAVSDIEKGTLINKYKFKCRTGEVLSVECISTGCKAAILAQQNKHKFIDMIEVGVNALDFIVNTVRSGHIIMEYPDILFSDIGNGSCDVGILGYPYNFKSVRDLNYFIDNCIWCDEKAIESPETIVLNAPITLRGLQL